MNLFWHCLIQDTSWW